ncbi:lantibiotic dehydratase [Spirosoma sp. KUDC1026]|uniref:lantibiotic dehydratase n=1 Tax=Spirosoma sp. KUDC1026 TaxID=2745947 RepID=UPI00159B9D96|nr:lantibiotic dehydratase [Spirosoma sp. KUDC1026]QKZ11296.1 lantibiotic dehydratase [Spirosoma sp. KUDC1026]
MIRNAGFYLFRRPTNSIDALQQFHQTLTTQSIDEALRSWYSCPAAQEALYVASPSLYDRFLRWQAGESVSEAEKLQTTLYKYLIRMSTRCTPFGLFAGCTTGRINGSTNLQPRPSAPVSLHTRLDIECQIALKDWLINQPIVRQQLLVYPNSSLYPVSNTYRYIEQQRSGQQRHHFISAIETNDYLVQLLERAASGVTLTALQQSLIDMGVAPDHAQTYLEQLIENQLLVFEIEPTLTGPDYLHLLIGKIASLAGTDLLTSQLQVLRQFLDQQDNRLAAYQQIRGWLQQRGYAATNATTVQVDTFFPDAQHQLSNRVVQQLEKTIEKLAVLSKPIVCPDLDTFKHRFYHRYEDEEVSLALALDHEAGVGYGHQSALGVGYAPMIDDLALTTPATSSQAASDSWWQSFLLDKFTQTLRNQQSELLLTDVDIDQLSRHQTTPPTAHSFYAYGNLLASSDEAIDQGNFQFNMLACEGPSSVNLLSRFCSGDARLQELVQTCLKAEEQHHPDVIFAEIVHCPDSRAGNIMSRPGLYAYEIPYLGKSSLPADQQIPIQDLVVSIRNSQVILRSRRLNKRVIPRLSNAHNYHDGLPVYRFLCDLQHQDAHLHIRWDWSLLHQQAYLPRVRYRQVILSRATWLLQRVDFKHLSVVDTAEKMRALGIPQHVFIASADSELFIDSHVPASLQLLVQVLRKQETTRLIECLVPPVTHADNPVPPRFLHEIIIPLCNPDAPRIPGLPPQPVTMPQRRFSIGSEWLYLKLYVGEKSADTVLINGLYPVIQQLLEKRIISQFFFLRYNDPDPHLRLRFRGNPHMEFYSHVIRAIEQILHRYVQGGIVHKIQVDTYQRELERYGVDQIDRCEALFCTDSLATLHFLDRTGDACDEQIRFMFAISKIDHLLIEANLCLSERHALLQILKDRFFLEFNGDSALRKQLNEKYRQYQPDMKQVLGQRNGSSGSDQTTELYLLATELSDRNVLFSILSSLIHMAVNRLFPYKQRAYELIIYHCLTKYYDSTLATSRLTV